MPDIAGLKLIVPTSATATGTATVSIGARGKVTFTGINSGNTVSIEGVFSSTYDNYLMVWTSTEGSASLMALRLRVSGTDASGTDYTSQSIDANNTSVTGARATSQTYARVGYPDDNYSGHHVYFYGPNLAQPTAIREVGVLDISGARILDLANTHSLSTAYTGFTIFGINAAPNTIDGKFCIYGLSQ